MGGSGGLLGGVGTFLFGDGGASKQAEASNNAIAASSAATEASLALQKEMWQKSLDMQKPMYDLGLDAAQKAFGGKDAKGNFTFDPTKLNQYTVNTPFNYQDFNKGQDFSYNAFTADPKQYATQAPSQRGDFQYNSLNPEQINASQYNTQAQNAQSFNPNIDVTQDPSYQFRLQQGINALDKSASSRGKLLSGQQLKAVEGFGQDLASQEYGNAYNRALQANQQNNSVIGQNFTQQLGANAQNIGNALNVAQYKQGAQGQQYAQALGALQQNVGQDTQNFQNQLSANAQNLGNQMNVQNQQYNQALGANNQNFAQNLAQYQQNQGNALTGYNSNVNLGNQRYNQLASVLGLGQTSANQLQNNNAQYSNAFTGTQMQNAQNLGSAYAYAGNAAASGSRWAAQQGANALGQGLNFASYKGWV